MRITSLEIERFGIWEHLYLPKISRGLNLFYGPNEAGKTTLMQFIRSGLYGCSNPERARYIQMALYPKAESPFAQNRYLSPTEIDETDSREKKKGTEPDETREWIGGALTVQDEFGRHRLERRYLRRSASLYDRTHTLEAKAGFIISGGLAAWSGRFFPIPGMGIAESLVISGEDGARLSDHFVQTIVNNVDEATFNNVFAIGLDELQRLGALNETDAAQMLYRLSVGMDRVSLIQVLHQLVEERNEIFDIKGKPAILDSLLARREDFTQKALGASVNLREYASLRSEQNDAEEALRQLEEKLNKHRRQKRVYEIARQLAALWDERSALNLSLADYGAVIAVEADAVREAGDKKRAIDDVKKSLAALADQYRSVRKDLKTAIFSQSVWKNAPQIDLLVEEIPRLETLDHKMAKVQFEITGIQKELDLEEQRLRGARHGKIILTPSVLQSLADPATGLTASGSSPAPPSDASKEGSTEAVPEIREIEDYRLSARAVNAARKRYLKVREQNGEVAERLKSVEADLDRELTSRGQKSLDEAMETTGELVVQLRRRVEIAKRLADLEKIRRELTRQNGYLVANQSLPYPVTIAIGIGVSLGGLLAVFAFLGKGPFEPSFGILGILLAVAVLFYKTTIEHKNYARLEENQRQLATVMKRLEQVKAEAAAIDNRYPAPGQSVESRLQKAESDLAHFERLLPLDTKWKETAHHQKVLKKRLKLSKEALSSAHRRWIGWLKTAGLSTDLKPSHIKAMIQRVDFADGLRRRIDLKRNEVDLLLRERKGITERLERILTETGTAVSTEWTSARQIGRLRELLDQVRAVRKRRAESIRRLNDLRKERHKMVGRIHRMNVDLDDYLALFEAKSVDHLEKQAARYRDHQALLSKLRGVEGQIKSGIGDFCPESEIADILDDAAVRPNLPTLMTAVDQRIDNLTEDQKEKTLHIGRLSEQLENLARQKEFIGYQFERSAATLRIDEMARIWQSRAVACKMMEDIRKAYEKERQPETLKEASRLLSRLTDGLYVKIWTPLGEDTLYVDTQEGQTLDIASLSRGTREQLFIAIRLALAISFEKHGVNLPLILDDVLVNFDNHRATAAANVLNEFAESGRQIFLFTCHQHICRTFLKLDKPVFVLPEKSDRVKQFRVILPPSMDKLPDEPEESPKKRLPAEKKVPSAKKTKSPPKTSSSLPREVTLKPNKSDVAVTVENDEKAADLDIQSNASETIGVHGEPALSKPPLLSVDPAPMVTPKPITADAGGKISPWLSPDDESDLDENGLEEDDDRFVDNEWDSEDDDEEDDDDSEIDDEEDDDDSEIDDVEDDDDSEIDDEEDSVSDDFEEEDWDEEDSEEFEEKERGGKETEEDDWVDESVNDDEDENDFEDEEIDEDDANDAENEENDANDEIEERGSGNVEKEDGGENSDANDLGEDDVDLETMDQRTVSDDIPIDGQEEEESSKTGPILFSTWNDLFNQTAEPTEKTPEEDSELREEKQENDFIRHFFTRQPQEDFFSDDKDESDRER